MGRCPRQRGRSLQPGGGPGRVRSLSRSSKGSAKWPSSRPPASPRRSDTPFSNSLWTLSLRLHSGQGPCDPRSLRSVATAVRQVSRGRGLGTPALGAGHPLALGRRPPVPGRDERDPRPLARTDRDGGSEKPEGRRPKEVVTSDGGSRWFESGTGHSNLRRILTRSLGRPHQTRAEA
jgi:hypothetical protein